MPCVSAVCCRSASITVMMPEGITWSRATVWMMSANSMSTATAPISPPAQRALVAEVDHVDLRDVGPERGGSDVGERLTVNRDERPSVEGGLQSPALRFDGLCRCERRETLEHLAGVVDVLGGHVHRVDVPDVEARGRVTRGEPRPVVLPVVAEVGEHEVGRVGLPDGDGPPHPLPLVVVGLGERAA